MNAPYPWLNVAWQQLVGAAEQDKLGHAYLVTGPAGCGKRAFARAAVDWLLCDTPHDGAACGACRSCTQLAAGFHPDLRVLAPEEDKRNIAIDQVRGLIDFFALTAHGSKRKLALVQPAEAMNTAAANALLKILEEPPGDALLLLVSDRHARLLPTIRSRCQQLALTVPDTASLDAWLAAEASTMESPPDLSAHSLVGGPLAIRAQLAGGEVTPFDRTVAALHGLVLEAGDPIGTAQAFRDSDFPALIDTIELAVRAVLLLAEGSEPRHVRAGGACARRLQEITDKLNCKRLFLFLDHVTEARRILNRSSGVRGIEIIENLFLSWARAARAETNA